MKSVFSLVLLTVLLCSISGCRKNEIILPANPQDPLIAEAIDYMKAHLTESDFNTINLENYVTIKAPGKGTPIIRFFVKNNSGASVTIVRRAEGLSGNWFRIEENKAPAIGFKTATWKARALQGNDSSEIVVRNNHPVLVTAFRQGKRISLRLSNEATNIFVPADSIPSAKYNPEDDGWHGQWLPDCVVIGYHHSDPTTFFSLFWITNMDPFYLNSFSVGDIFGNPEDMGGGGSFGNSQEILEIPVFEFDNSNPIIDLRRKMKCFDNIPDAGATYGITLYADIPDNHDPLSLLNNVTPGHAFISLVKTNGNKSVRETFGFYPVPSMLTVFNVGVHGLIQNNEKIEFNASITMQNISEIDFNAAKSLAVFNSENRLYDLNDFNCTDFALEIFNVARALDEKLTMPDWTTTALGINYGMTPNGLYLLLKEKKIQNTSDASNINIGTLNAPVNTGDCK